MRLLVCIIILSITITVQAQVNNLVANPSFENYSGCPITTAQIDSADFWFQPLEQSSTDYFNVCCSIPDFTGVVGIPQNGFGFQYAHSGNAYAGFMFYQGGSKKEYLEGTLIEPLFEGKEYCVEFYYSICDTLDQYFFTSSLGIFFSNDSVLSDTNITIPVVPQVLDITIDDTSNWVKFSGNFTAVGGELFMLIGNFESNHIPNGIVYGFIDDVSVYLCDDTLPKPLEELKIPNMFSPNNDEWNNEFVIENLPEGATVEIYNRWGALVAEWNAPNGSWDGRTKGGAESSAGVYYCIVKLVNGELKSSFLQLLR